MKMSKYMLGMSILIILNGCGGGSSGSSTAGGSTISELEENGSIPVLDRTPDVAGVDANTNGIRDDIDSYINTMPITEDQKKGVIQLAKTVQESLLVDVTNGADLRKINQGISRSIQCLSVKFPNVQERLEVITSIESKTANTRERTDKYIKLNNALSGSVSKLLSGDTCDE